MRNRSIKPKKKAYKERTAEKPILAMSEQEKIEQGFRNPYRVVPNFAKDKEERKAWKKVHSSKKGPTSAGMITRGRTEPEFNLIVNITPNEANKFKTTHCFKARKSEIGIILMTFFDKENITKITYAGKPYSN